MAGEIPPPPPGFVLEGGSPAPAIAARPDAPVRPAYNGPLPTRAEDLFQPLVMQESGGRTGVRGPMTQYGQALGRTQMLPATAREVSGRLGLPYREELLTGTSPEAAAYQDRLGLAYLQEGFDKTGNARDALHYYHGGPDRRLWGPKTRNYADSILARYGSGGAPAPSAAEPQTAMAPPPPPEGFVIQDGATAAPAGAPGSSRESAIDLTRNLFEDEIPLLVKGAWVKGQDGEVFQIPSDAYFAQPDSTSDRQAANTYIDRPDAGDGVEAFATAASEQIPFMDEAAAGVAGLTTGRGFDAVRDQQMLTRGLLNDTNGTARDIGGVAGFGLGLLAPGGGWLNGAKGATAVARAGALGAGYGALYGAGNTDGDLGDRTGGAFWGAGIGGVSGSALRGLSGVLGERAARAAAEPSTARRLSAAGVDLTPGQMAGGILRRTEDGMTSIPVLGDAIRSAQRAGLETFDNVATNTAIEPIGAVLKSTAGRQGVRAADDAISGAYTRALQGVTVAPDAAFTSDVAQAVRPAGLTPDMRRNLGVVTGNILEGIRQGPLTGDAWKAGDSQLAAAIRAADKASGSAPEQRLLRDRLQEVRAAYRGLLGRTDQAALDATDAADRASAQYRLVRKATADVASAGRGGNASPQTLNRAVLAAGGERRAARGESLLQDLTDDAMEVLPSTVPDSGTALRGLLSLGGLGGGAAAVGANPVAVGAGILGVTGGSALYSRPVQRLINRAYRAKSPGAVRGVLADAQRLGAENPAVLQGVLQALSPSPLAEQAQLRERLARHGDGPPPRSARSAQGLLSQ